MYYAHLVVVGAVVRRGAPDALRTKARTRTEGGPNFQRRPKYRHVVVPDLPHVLHVREAHKRAHPREVRQLRSHEGGDGPVPDRLGGGQPDLQRPFDLRVRPSRRDGGLALPGLVALETLQRLFVRRSRPPRAAVFVSQIVLLSDSYPSPEQESSRSEHTHLPGFYPAVWRPEVTRPLVAPGQGPRAVNPAAPAVSRSRGEG